MNKRSLKKLRKSELIELLLKHAALDNIILPPLEFRDRPVPTPRKSVKQMVQNYEEKSRVYKPRPPIPTPRTKIEQTDKALEGYTKSYKISIKNNNDPLAQMQNTRKAAKFHLWITY